MWTRTLIAVPLLSTAVMLTTVHAETSHVRATDAVDVVVEGWSEHLGRGDFNEHHRALGFEWAIESDGRWRTLIAGGRFINSRNDPAWYASVGWMRPLYQRGPFTLEAGGYVGLAQSESYYHGEAFPFAAPGLSAYMGRLGINLILVPPVKDNTAAVSLQLKVGLFDGQGESK